MNKQISINKLLIVGSVAYDSIQTPLSKVNKTLGGSGSYFSLAASYFTRPSLVAVVGDDFKSADVKVLANRKIDISGLKKAKGKTFHWAGKYHYDLNSRDTLKTKLGVFANFKPILSPAHQQAEYVFLGNIHPSLQLDVLGQIKSAARRTKFVGLDTMNYWIESAPAELANILGKVDILIINDSEARELTKEHNIVKAAGKILKQMSSPSPNPSHQGRGNKVLIIKRGEYGLLMFSHKRSVPIYRLSKNAEKLAHYTSKNLQIFTLPGYPLEDVNDPTGAGDSFAGGFMGYLAKTDNTSWTNLKRACVAGSVMASFCVESLGVKRLLNISRTDISKRLKDFKELTDFEV